MSRKTKTEASTSTGMKQTRKKASSTPTPKKTLKPSSKTTSTKTKTPPKVKTQQSLNQNLSTLTSPQQQKKTKKSSGTTRKAKVKKLEFKPTRSREIKLFPHPTFPYRVELKSEKRIAWFQCEEHAIKFLTRHHPKPFTHYKYYVFPDTQS